MADTDNPQGDTLPPAETPAPTAAFTQRRGEPDDPRIGGTLGQGKYRIVGTLGRGGMGVVYEAEDKLLQRRVAIKLLPDSLAEEPSAVQRFIREAQAAARLSHPNAVAILEVDQREGISYIVMELVRGGTTQDHLNLRGRFDWREATRITADICRALVAAHAAGLVHRDIKPANILRAPDGTVKLADFGLAKFADLSVTSVTAAGKVVGTPQFMSPEQCQCRPLDDRSDLYSLGGCYFALLTAQPPYPGDNPMEVMFAHVSDPVPDPRSLNPDLPASCAAIVRKAMAKAPAQRFAKAGEMLAALETVLAGGQWSAKPAGGPLPAPPAPAAPAPGPGTTSIIATALRRPWLPWLVASGALLTLLAIALLIWSSRSGNAPVEPPARSSSSNPR